MENISLEIFCRCY